MSPSFISNKLAFDRLIFFFYLLQTSFPLKQFFKLEFLFISCQVQNLIWFSMKPSCSTEQNWGIE